MPVIIPTIYYAVAGSATCASTKPAIATNRVQNTFFHLLALFDLLD